MQRKEWGIVLVIAAIVVVRALWFEDIIHRPLNDFDEARYAEIAKNIIRTGEWIIPLAGGPDEPRTVPRFTRAPQGVDLYPYLWKPPLHVWIMATGFAVGGMSELMVRLPSLIAALGVLAVVYGIARRLTGSIMASTLAVASLMALPDFSFLSAQGVPDMLFLWTALAAIWIFGSGRRESLIVSGIAFGLAIMTKSFAAFWILPVALLYHFVVHKRMIRWHELARFSAAAGIVVVPWHIYAWSLFGDLFITRYFFMNVLERASGAQLNAAPIYWYVVYMIRSWAPLIVAASCGVIASKWGSAKGVWLTVLSACWVALVVLPYSMMQSKVWWYIFPVAVPAALAAGGSWLMARQKAPNIRAIFLMLSAVLIIYPLIMSCVVARERDFGTSVVRQMASEHKGLTRLAVYGMPYEATLFYMDVGTISFDPSTAAWVLTDHSRVTSEVLREFREADRIGGLVLLQR